VADFSMTSLFAENTLQAEDTEIFDTFESGMIFVHM